MSDDDDRKEKARKAAKILSAGSDIADTLAGLSQAKAYRNVDFKAPPVTTNDEDHAAAMSTTTAYDGKQQTSISDDNGKDINGKDILSKKEKKLIKQDLNFTTM